MIYTLVKKDSQDVIESITSFSSVKSFSESWSATVTSQTVEAGFDISDNVNIEAPSYSIDAVLSQYTLFDVGKEIVWDGEIFSGKTKTENKLSHVDARDNLIKLFQSKSLITLLETSENSTDKELSDKILRLKSGYNKEIDNCIITSLSLSSPDSSSGAFMVSLTIQQVNIAFVDVIALREEEMSPILQPLIVDVKKVGNKQTKDIVAGDTGVPVDDSYADEPATQMSAGSISKEDGFAQERADEKYKRDRLKALQDAKQYAKLTEYIYEVKEQGGVWIPTRMSSK